MMVVHSISAVPPSFSSCSLSQKKGNNEGLSGISEFRLLSLSSLTSPFSLLFCSSDFITFLGLIGVSDSGNGVTCILLLLEIEDFAVADVAAVLVVFFSFLDAGFFLFDFLVFPAQSGPFQVKGRQ